MYLTLVVGLASSSVSKHEKEIPAVLVLASVLACDVHRPCSLRPMFGFADNEGAALFFPQQHKAVAQVFGTREKRSSLAQINGITELRPILYGASHSPSRDA